MLYPDLQFFAAVIQRTLGRRRWYPSLYTYMYNGHVQVDA